MQSKNRLFKRKKIIVFGYEGKNNKTETSYFSHFRPKDGNYILKHVSCGYTDPVNMIKFIKEKRKAFDYKPSEDKTFLFVDIDGNEEKLALVRKLEEKLGKDLKIIKSSPIFEIFYLNHFIQTSKVFRSNEELLKELRKHIPEYEKNKDVYDVLFPFHEKGIRYSKTQASKNNECCFTDVYKLFDNSILE